MRKVLHVVTMITTRCTPPLPPANPAALTYSYYCTASLSSQNTFEVLLAPTVGHLLLRPIYCVPTSLRKRNMSCDQIDTHCVLGHQLRPALILDAEGSVVAANAGSGRLIAPTQLAATQYNSDQHPLLCKNVADLGLAPLPGDPPVLWTWSELLRAAIDVSRPDTNRGDRKCHDHARNIDVVKATDDFWAAEAELQATVETDIYVTRQE